MAVEETGAESGRSSLGGGGGGGAGGPNVCRGEFISSLAASVGLSAAAAAVVTVTVVGCGEWRVRDGEISARFVGPLVEEGSWARGWKLRD